MSATVILQVPDDLMERLHRQSQAHGRSINETAVRALLAGLEEPAQGAWWIGLGPLVVVPPTRPFDPERFRRLQAGLHADAQNLLDVLDWVRGTE